jgi:hypothetical protein
MEYYLAIQMEVPMPAMNHAGKEVMHKGSHIAWVHIVSEWPPHIETVLGPGEFLADTADFIALLLGFCCN